jgi:hypothetical protein
MTMMLEHSVIGLPLAAMFLVAGPVSLDAAAQQSAPVVTGTGTNAGKIAMLDAEATRLRPEMRKRMEAMPACIDKANTIDGKRACVHAVRKVVMDYFEAEIAIRQDWVEHDQQELKDVDRRLEYLRTRSALEKAEAARRQSDDLLSTYALLQDDLRARLARERQASEPDKKYIAMLESTIAEYDAALEELRYVYSRADRPGLRVDESINNLNQYRTYAEARLRYTRAHKETYVMEQEIALSMLTVRETEIDRDSIRPGKRGPRPPDTETDMGVAPRPTSTAPVTRIPAAASSPPSAPRYSTIDACRKDNPVMRDDQCVEHVKPRQ